MNSELAHEPVGDAPILRLILENERAVTAADLGRLLTALAIDYKKVTRGQTLVITRVEDGSIWIWLQDGLSALEPFGKAALGLAKAAKGLRDFYETIKSAIKPTSVQNAAQASSLDLKTARSLLKLSVESGSTVEFEHVSGGVRLGFKVTPHEAVARQHELDEARKANKARQQAITVSSVPQLSAEKLMRLAHSGPDGMVAVEEAISIVASSLRGQGLEYALLPIADELDGHGLSQLAEVVRAAVRRGRGHSGQVTTSD